MSTLDDLIGQYLALGCKADAEKLARSAGRELSLDELKRLKQGCLDAGKPDMAAEAAKLCGEPITPEEADQLVDICIIYERDVQKALQLGATLPAQDKAIRSLLEKSKYRAENLALIYGSQEVKIAVVEKYLDNGAIGEALELAEKFAVLSCMAARLIAVCGDKRLIDAVVEIVQKTGYQLSDEEAKPLIATAIYWGSSAALKSVTKLLGRAPTQGELDKTLARVIATGGDHEVKDILVLLGRELTQAETDSLVDNSIEFSHFGVSCAYAQNASVVIKEKLLATCLQEKNIEYALKAAASLGRSLTDQELKLLSPVA